MIYIHPFQKKDGSKIIFVRAFELIETQVGKSWENRDIFEIDLKTLKEKQLTFNKNNSVYYPKYYKNENGVIIYQSDDYDESTSCIFLNDINNNLVKKIGILKEGYNSTFSSNFNLIAYVGRTRKSFDIFLMDIDTQKIKNLTDYQKYMYTICPDFSTYDERIIFLADEGFKGKWNLFEVTIDGNKIDKIL